MLSPHSVISIITLAFMIFWLGNKITWFLEMSRYPIALVVVLYATHIIHAWWLDDFFLLLIKSSHKVCCEPHENKILRLDLRQSGMTMVGMPCELYIWVLLILHKPWRCHFYGGASVYSLTISFTRTHNISRSLCSFRMSQWTFYLMDTFISISFSHNFHLAFTLTFCLCICQHVFI